MQQKQNKETKSLSSAVIKGTSWLFLFQILDNIIGFVRLIFIARLLSPNDYGLIGVALLLLQILNTFSQTGIQQYIIHKKDYEKFLNAGWTYLVFRGFALYVILFFSAPIISQFFNNTSAVDVIRLVGITVLLDGFTNIGVVLFQKNMTFRKQFYYQFAGNFSDFIVALILALLLHNVWALVWGTVANSFARMIFSYILSEYKPKFELNIKRLKEMNHYGKWIFGSNILQFLYSQGDDILVGRLLGTVSLGYYQMAYRISNLPATQITHLVSTVMFPAYSKMQDSVDKLRVVYLRNLQITAHVSFFVGIIIIGFSNDFILIILGEKWIPIVTTMQILTLWGIIRSIGATTGPLWQAIGTPHIITKIQIIQTSILAVIIYPLTYTYSMNGTAIAVVISVIVPNIISLILISKTLNTKISYIIKELTFSLFTSLITLSAYFILETSLFVNINLINFFILALICSSIYLFITILLAKFFHYTIFNNIYILIDSSSNEGFITNRLKKILITLI